MADSQAWAEGAAIGSERAKEHRAHKQALSEEERQSKAQLYASNLTNLQQKISSLPKGSQEYNDAFNEIQNNLHGVRELYDPDRHPGLIASHGHLITDALGITNPATNPGIKKEAARRAAGVEGDERAAQGIAAAAPLSPEQQGTQRGQGQAAEDLAVFQGKMKIYDQQNPHASSPDATPEEKQARQEYINELINSTSGVKEPKEPIETWTDVKGAVAEEYPKGSGQYRILQQNKKGERHWGDALAPDAPKQGKSGTSVFSVSLDTYAKSHGYDSFNDVPNDYKEKIKDYEIRKGVLDRTISRKSIVTRVMQDAEGHPFTATVTNYSGPAGTEELIDPMPMKQGAAPQSSEPISATPNHAKTNPSSPTLDKVKKDAKALNTPPAGGRNAKFGPPDTSIQMKTPGITKLGEQHDAAVELVSEAQDAVAQPNNAELQFLLVDNILHGALGRVNEIEIKKIQDRGGWALAPERWEQEASAGTMAPQLVKQLLDFTLSQQKAIEKAQATHGNPANGGTTSNAGNMTDDEFLMKVK